MNKTAGLLALLTVAAVFSACRTDNAERSSVISLDSLERRNIALRLPASPDRYDREVCVRSYARAILADSAGFAQGHYSFVRTMPNESYEMCRYDDHTVLEIANYGCEYFGFSFRWCYNDLAPEVSDARIVERAIENTKAIAPWCTEIGSYVGDGADFLETYAREKGAEALLGNTLDFYPPDDAYGYRVRVEPPVRFGNAACIEVAYSLGPL